MKKMIFAALLSIISCTNQTRIEHQAALDVLNRTIGLEKLKNFRFLLKPNQAGREYYDVKKINEQIVIEANSQVNLVRGTYDYLKNNCNSIISWSGSKINIPNELPPVNKRVKSPYRYRYYFNVVTHGYTTAYWNFSRWEKEIDWMALHGINMPLIGGAHEAILKRVFESLGLTPEEINQYFSGPAHFPWNRMGNLHGWDGPVPHSYYPKQIQLTHNILDRMTALGITPIIQAFAGFVPKSIKRIYPDIEIRELGWGGGLPEENNAFILSPDSELFVKIGKLFIEEWEKEFGKNKFYLADSFNEMDVPLPSDHNQALSELAGYGESVYRSIKAANPDAVWVMQGWTFPFHKDDDGKLFWTPERLNALVSKVPDDKLLILDLANEYNHVFWKIDPSWKMYQGFFGKQWIYSFIPNMGGKVPLNGRLDVYASIPIDALNYSEKKKLVGFGFAPEGIENNEIVYELLSDMAWRTKKIDLNAWIERYCVQRYGAFPSKMQEAFTLLNQSCFGSFTDHPIHRYQLRPYKKPEGVENHATVHRSDEFNKAVGAFLSCSIDLGNSELYQYDAIELVSQYLGLVADEKLRRFLNRKRLHDYSELEEALEILLIVDRLLASHPNHNLQKWVEFARSWGDNEQEKKYYESNAKRLLTTWGGDPVNNYSGRTWSGLIRDYYVPRWKHYYEAARNNIEFDLREWEEQWIMQNGVSSIEPFDDPVSVAIKIYEKYQ